MIEIEARKPELTARPVNSGAEKWLAKPIEVLNHGFVYLVDYMGDDQAIEQAARVSHGAGTRKVSQTEGLLRYLMRHDHTSPFEMVEFKFHAKMPIFVARQWVRHRTASINEISGRYSVLKNEFYMPDQEVIAVQSTDNKQGRGASVSPEYANEIRVKLGDSYNNTHELYSWLLGEGDDDKPGVAKELARIPLPVATYTEWYWKIDLHNLLHFQKLRMDSHAQWEIRQYANAMGGIIKDSVPITWKAFEDYQLNAIKLTSPEQDVLALLLSGKSFTKEEIMSAAERAGLSDKLERSEMVEKFRKLNLLDLSLENDT
jgi:thymidylate synthase (FAD)